MAGVDGDVSVGGGGVVVVGGVDGGFVVCDEDGFGLAVNDAAPAGSTFGAANFGLPQEGSCPETVLRVITMVPATVS